ncbi:MAG: hypothetical protein IJP85_05130 [Synergistaceae bacterium]|nr:hypothetical protein [Synergistaceae bacterium]
MEADTKTEKETLCYAAPNFSTDDRYKHPSTEEFLRAARKMMRLYDEDFRELAK